MICPAENLQAVVRNGLKKKNSGGHLSGSFSEVTDLDLNSGLSHGFEPRAGLHAGFGAYFKRKKNLMLTIQSPKGHMTIDGIDTKGR